MNFTGRAPFLTCPALGRLARRLLGPAFLFLLSSSAVSAQTLGWNPNPESNLAGYRVQYGTSSTTLTTTVDVGNVTSYRFTNLQAGTTYYFRVLAYNTAGQVSSPSSQVSYTVPSAPAPTAPTLSSVSPASGPTNGGTVITLTGTNFASGATVRVGGVAATGVTFVSSTQVRATTPSGSAGARDVQIVNPNGLSATRAGAFTYTSTTSALSITGVSPASGPTTGGTVITITGTGFASGATVAVGGVAATGVTFVGSTQLRATTPAGTAGARDVRVVNPNGTSTTRTGAFTYTSSSTPGGTPTVTSVSPSSGPTSGGTTITITGTNFVPGAIVRLDGVNATNVVWVSSTRLTARTPANPAGTKEVQVRNPDGQRVFFVGFTYTSTTTSAATGTFSSFLAEGVQTEQMSTQLAIANAEETDAQVNLTFMDAAGETSALAVEVPARSRQTVDLSTVPQLAGQTFSTRVDATQPVAVDRLVSLDAAGEAASLETAVTAASPTWYFAEGSTVDPLELFYLVQNPGPTAAQVEVRYLRAAGQPAVTRTYEVAAGSRATIWVDREDAALASAELAAAITSVDGTPIVVERSLYLKEPGMAQPRGGDTSAGVTAPATRWTLEASTGAYRSRLLLANPGSEAAEVRAAYTREDGRRVARTYTVPAGSRQSIDVAAEHPSLADAQLAVTLEASQPIVAERSKWWGADGRLDEAVSGGGTTEGAARWLLAEAEQGGARQASTEVAIVNLGAETEVKVTLLFEGAPEMSATFPVAAGARFTVPMAEAFPGIDGRRFSVLVEGADPAASLVVDRAIFWQGGGRTAGADGAAQRLR